MTLTCIDLFSGCGGLSLGLAKAGFEHLFAIEAHPHAFETYYRNLVKDKPYQQRWPKWLPQSENDILSVLQNYTKELGALRGHVDLVAGGPPCQGFSLNGRRDPQDPRSEMIGAYFEFVRLVRPRIVLLENVQGFASMPHSKFGTYPKFAKAKLAELGYNSYEALVMASEFGVPQRRPRYILVGIQTGFSVPANPIELLYSQRLAFLDRLGLGPTPVTAAEALFDLETRRGELQQDPEHGKSGFMAAKYVRKKHKSRFLKLMRDGVILGPTDMRLAKHSLKVTDRFQDILSNCERGKSISISDRERFGIKKRSVTPLAPDAPSPTITTLPDDLVHYSEPRIMTVREHARLQSFPDWFQFFGPYTTGGHRRKVDCPRYTQVGNAVPPLLAQAIGETIMTLVRTQLVTDRTHIVQIEKEITTMGGEIMDGYIRRSISV